MKPSFIVKSGAQYPPGKEFFASGQGHFPIAGAGVDCLLYKNYEIAKHTHGFTELNLVCGGRGEHFIEDQAFAVRAGDVFVIPRQVQHAYRQELSLNVYHLLLSDQFLDRHSASLWMLPGFILFFTVEPFFRAETDFRFGLRLNARRSVQVAGLFDQILAELARPAAGSALAIEALALYAVSQLCRDYVDRFGDAGKNLNAHPRAAAIQGAMAFMEQHYARRIALGELARQAHMAPNHFGRVFRAATRLTPMAYLQQVRIRAARQMLLSTDFSITEIALKAGFYDSAHFSRTFTAAVGRSPNRFRRRAQA
ncbi:MAG: helix-turn-helix transcriptional regulator [Planctomycetes bacterium]|nr:helix-turn-helix transcriptional regulator [Planctomycetota bacterium]